MKRVILDNGDGTTKVLAPAPRFIAELMAFVDPEGDSLTYDEAVDFIAQKDCQGLSYEIVDTDTLPPSDP